MHVKKQSGYKASVIGKHLLSIYRISRAPFGVRVVAIFLGIIVTSIIEASIHRTFGIDGKLGRRRNVGGDRSWTRICLPMTTGWPCRNGADTRGVLIQPGGTKRVGREIGPPVRDERRSEFIIQMGLPTRVGTKPALDARRVVAFAGLRPEG